MLVEAMAWYLNHYECYRCGENWDDEWSCACDDECPSCGARHASPVESDDLTFTIEDKDHCFVVLKSSDEAEHRPDYREVIRFLSKDFAEAYIRAEPAEGIV
jgi:predicted  nucleic acid-binding Zn-ribbon protein